MATCMKLLPCAPSRDQRGFSLVELLAAVVVTSVIVAAMMTTLVSSNRASQTNSNVADTQQNVRIAMDILSKDIRLAGFNYNALDPSTTSVGGCVLGTPARAVAIRPQDQNIAGVDAGPDSLSMVIPAMTTVTTPWTLNATAGGEPPNPVVPFTSISLSDAAITEMKNQGLAAGAVVSIGGAVSKTVLSAGTTTISFPTPIEAQFPIGTQVYLMQCIQYQVSTSPVVCGSSSTACLTRSNTAVALSTVPLVDGIEDIQLAYACDGCNTVGGNPPSPDGIIDNVDGSNTAGVPTFTQGDFVSDSQWSLTPMTPDKIRLVQVSIVARQSRADQGVTESGKLAVNSPNPVVVGDHTPTVDATYQQQRRRVLVRTVQPRNL